MFKTKKMTEEKLISSAQVRHDFYNTLNNMLGNKFPDVVQKLTIELSLDEPVKITAEYYIIDPNKPLSENPEILTKKFEIVEINDEQTICPEV